MTLSGYKKQCLVCLKPMQRWGKQPSGNIRWRCDKCGVSSIRKRQDNRYRKRLSLFVKWLMSKMTLLDVAKQIHGSARSVRRWFEPLWQVPPKPKIPTSVRVLVLDATSVKWRECMLLVASDADTRKTVSWKPTGRECYDAWFIFLYQLREAGIKPYIVVCDGQRGLIKAIHEVFPQAYIQRCLIHVIRQSNIWLTQNPKTKAGKDLLLLVQQLTNIQTKRQKRKWINSFRYWNRRHKKFLKERTETLSGRRWYTHRRLRGTKALIQNAIPDLFRHITNVTIPRTSNVVEGGINARIKELFRCHRGISTTKKLALASWYLAIRQGQKPTNNGH